MKEKSCRIAQMLARQKRHISFHTPGHKRAGYDITELSYSDCLLSPTGAIKEAETEIARILGADRSFILTDGSTSGVYAMLHCLKAAGAQSVAFSAFSHKSVKEGCRLMGLVPVEIGGRRERGVPMQPYGEEIERSLDKADALLLTSPDYYGNFPPLAFAKDVCERRKKLLLIDGAHGAHLHFSPEYAGNFAHLWVDGVHKSLPALTQGAVVSAKGAAAELLGESVNIFRTTSPSYPIMASVEYAVKYPRNPKIEGLAVRTKKQLGAYENGDWSKILIAFGDRSDEAQTYLERCGIFPEFNDGNYLMFYLSPCTKERELKKLIRCVNRIPRGVVTVPPRLEGGTGEKIERVPPERAVGRVCAEACGLFPPCVPLVSVGERITAQAAERLMKAEHTFGMENGIAVFLEKE